MFVIKHVSGWYFKYDPKKSTVVDCFSTMNKNFATTFYSKDLAQQVIDRSMEDFIPSLLSIEPVE